MTNATLREKPNAGNPHVRLDEGEVASGKTRRGSRSCNVSKGCVAALSSILTSVALATAYTDIVAYQSLSGRWSDDSLWRAYSDWSFRSPQDGDLLWTYPGANKGDLTITLSEDMIAAVNKFMIGYNQGTTLTIDGAGHSLAPADSATDVYDDNVFAVVPAEAWGSGNYNHFIGLANSGVDSPYRRSPYRMTDPLMRFYTTNDLVVAEFSRGTYDFYTAGGVECPERPLYLGADNMKDSTLTLFDGVTVDVGTLDYRANAPTNYVVFADSTLNVHGVFEARRGYFEGPKLASFDVTDGTRMTVSGSIAITDWDGYGPAYQAYRPNRLFSVRNGSVLSVGLNMELTAPLLMFELSGGSTYNGNSGAAWLGTGAQSSNCVVRIDSSTWNGGTGDLKFGAVESKTPLRASVVDSVLNLKSTWEFNRCISVMTNSTADLSDNWLMVCRGSDVSWNGGSVTRAYLQVGRGNSYAPETGSALTINSGDFGVYKCLIGNGISADSVVSRLVLNGGRLSSTGDQWGSVWLNFIEVGTEQAGALELNGGVVETAHLRGGSAASSLIANGGRILCMATDGSPFIAGIGEAKIGEKGLVVDTAGRSPLVQQDFSDVAGNGVLEKIGAGTLTLEVSAYSVARTCVSQGALSLTAAGADSFATSLELANGTVFSLSNGKKDGVNLAGLSVDGGTIVLDVGDTIHVSGPVSLHRLTVRFADGSSLSSPGDWLSVDGELSAENLKELNRAMCETEMASGKCAKFIAEYLEGVTTVRVAVVDRGEPFGDDATTVSQGGEWSAAGSWTKGVPTADVKASFPAARAGTVVVAKESVAGALEFCGGDYVLEEGDVTIAGTPGSAAMAAVAAGTAEVHSSLSFGQELPISLVGDTCLTLHNVCGGAMSKDGVGELVLAGSADLTAPLSVRAGRVTARGKGSVSDAGIELVSGTMRVQDDCTDVHALAVNASSATDSVILDVRTNVVCSTVNATSGAVVKRGGGVFVMDMTDGKTGSLGCGQNGAAGSTNNGMGPNVGPQVFPADGSSLTSGYGGFTVAEGTFKVHNDPTAANRLYAHGSVVIGMQLVECAAQPVLWLDGVYLDAYNEMPSATHFFVGAWAGDPGNAVTSPVLRMDNGAELYCDTLQVGNCSSLAAARPCVAMTNATLRGGYATYMTVATGDAVAMWRIKDSRIYAGNVGVNPVQFHGNVDFDAENSVLTGNGGYCGLRVGSGVGGRVFFHDGGRLAVNAVVGAQNLNKDFTLVFDNAEWRMVDSGDFAIPGGAYNDHFKVETVGRGLILNPLDATCAINVPLGGDGGLMVTNRGTVAFASGTYRFTGVCRLVRDAIVDLSAAGVISNGRFAGEGTVKSGSLGSATICVTEGVQVFDSCSFSGRTRVDFGRTDGTLVPEDQRKDIVVARYIGAAPDVSAWRAVNAGKGLRGWFRAEDGVIKADLGQSGMAIIIH